MPQTSHKIAAARYDSDMLSVDSSSYFKSTSDSFNGSVTASMPSLLKPQRSFYSLLRTQPQPIDDYRGTVLQELREAIVEAENDNWDGYGSKKASQSSFSKAIRLVGFMPALGMTPEVYVDPKGNIRMEWYEERRGTLILSVAGDGQISFACSLEDGTYKGNVLFENQFPEGLEYFIRKISIDAR